MAFNLLSQSDLAPAWTMMEANIWGAQEAARQAIPGAAMPLEERDPAYTRAPRKWAHLLAKINVSIDGLNQRVALGCVARPRSSSDREIEHIRRHSVST
ncbi:MAG TPA: hypothetical protein VJK02_14765 [Anaerolineales bacterium]|nr:hypothetical protein [Anaerolineales bacterium]